MDAVELFKRLGAGAKFDLKRFGRDAERFKVMSKHISGSLFMHVKEALSFHGIFFVTKVV